MIDGAFLDAVRSEAGRDGASTERAERIAHLVRIHTGRRWVGLYRVGDDEVANVAWSGPAPPTHPRFPVDRGLTGAAIRSRNSIISNDVGNEPRYLTALESTGSELIVPVLSDERVVGTLDVEDARTGAFDDADRIFFESVAAALLDLYT